MKELPTYRLELEAILTTCPNRRIFSITDCARYLGKSKDYIRDHLNIHGDITTQAFAHKLAELNQRSMKP